MVPDEVVLIRPGVMHRERRDRILVLVRQTSVQALVNRLRLLEPLGGEGPLAQRRANRAGGAARERGDAEERAATTGDAREERDAVTREETAVVGLIAVQQQALLLGRHRRSLEGTGFAASAEAGERGGGRGVREGHLTPGSRPTDGFRWFGGFCRCRVFPGKL